MNIQVNYFRVQIVQRGEHLFFTIFNIFLIVLLVGLCDFIHPIVNEIVFLLNSMFL
jgi:hypothetical protein